MRPLLGILLIALASGCVDTNTTQLSQNTIRVDVSAAPACGRTGAVRMVNKISAVETLRLGYDKYVIAQSASQDNVRVVGYNTQTYGSYGYGNFNASSYATPIVGGSRDAAGIVTMFNASDPPGRQAIDARQQLGPDWKEIVAKGAPSVCS